MGHHSIAAEEKDLTNAHWTTDWSARSLTPEEKDDFENLIADLYDWVVLSVDSCYDAVRENSATHPPSVDRVQLYYSAVLRYMLVELVMLCEDDEKTTVDEKMKKILDLVQYMVHKARVIDIEHLDREVEGVFLDREAYPSLKQEDLGSPEVQQDVLMTANLHDFAVRLYNKKLLTTLVPASTAIEAYFGPTPVRNSDTFLAATRWLTCAHDKIYHYDDQYKALWSSWYSVIQQESTRYRSQNGKEALRLGISGRTAQKVMETMDSSLLAHD
ncbi:uncharacterized protein JN550_007544 [Neoarthrinium moseri]|uniref:uncharacterized protein n=1 Tax=Neoarthrinium moseri TaxID=1658444 RepID=UPI001FDD5AD5|nr:uncharacterized protein JN550_007544 [Neoarthrinium moseri]KAI1866691.1 hypothetical protein JN550_007544 [Neoarthrinium moseri]